MTMAAYQGPDCDLMPDASAMHSFLAFWFEKTTQGMIELGWLDPDGRGVVHFAQFDRDNLVEACAKATQINLVPGQSVYVRAATVADRTKTGGFTTDRDFIQAPGIWGDIDTLEQYEHARTVQSIVRPNASVITGTVPHTRVQNWFRCSEPLASADLTRALNVRLHRLYGGDSAVVNPTRLMRLPGTIAWPWKSGRAPEVTQFIRPAADDPRPASYPIAMLSSQLPTDAPQATPTETAVAFGIVGGPTSVSWLIAQIRAGREWHNNVIRLVAIWVSRGWSTLEILIASEAFTLVGYTHEQTRREVIKAIEGARLKWSLPDADYNTDGATADPLSFPATPLDGLDLDNIPPRHWVYGRELVRGFVSVLASAGGTGKTAYTMVAGISVALCRSLFHTGIAQAPPDLKVHQGGAVWFYNLEDPQDELRRRIKATFQHYEISRSAVSGKLFLDSGRDRPLVVAVRIAGGGLVQAPVIVPLIAELTRREIAVLIIDPFVQSHSAEENRNDEMNLVMAAWGRVASEANCAIWLVHHFRKGGQGGDVEAVRGAGAIQGAARSMHTLSTMTADEANSLGVPPEDRWQFVRHDNVKQNMAPVAGKASWYRLVGVNLNNGNEDYPDGDSVQTVTAWTIPSPWDGMPWDMIAAILREIDRGTDDGEFYVLGKQSKERWAGDVVMRHTKKGMSSAKTILTAWNKAGLMVNGEPYDSKKLGKKSERIKVDQAVFSKMRHQQTMLDTADDH